MKGKKTLKEDSVFKQNTQKIPEENLRVPAERLRTKREEQNQISSYNGIKNSRKDLIP